MIHSIFDSNRLKGILNLLKFHARGVFTNRYNISTCITLV
jgi:hypothetical protein